MKKFLFVLLSVALAVSALAACNQGNSTDLGFFGSGSSSSVSSSERKESSSSSTADKEEDKADNQNEGWTDFY